MPLRRQLACLVNSCKHPTSQALDRKPLIKLLFRPRAASMLRSCAVPVAVVGACTLAAALIGRAAAARALGVAASSSQGSGSGSPPSGSVSGGGRTISQDGAESLSELDSIPEGLELLEPLQEDTVERDAERHAL